jgi:hypothetical protein
VNSVEQGVVGRLLIENGKLASAGSPYYRVSRVNIIEFLKLVGLILKNLMRKVVWFLHRRKADVVVAVEPMRQLR